MKINENNFIREKSKDATRDNTIDIPEKEPEGHRHRSCCLLFKLESGINLIIYLDFLMMIVHMMVLLSYMVLKEDRHSSNIEVNMTLRFIIRNVQMHLSSLTINYW